MYYTQRLELAERFLSLLAERNGGLFREHWSSDWHMGEKIAQRAWKMEGNIVGVVEFFIETSAEMDVTVTLTLGISSVPFSRLYYLWMPDDLHPGTLALRSILECEEALTLEIHDEDSLAVAIDKTLAFLQNEGIPWIEQHATQEGILSKLAGIGDREALELSILVLAGCGDLDGALRRFDEVLWPEVKGGGERMILERWRRLKAVILEEHERSVYARKEEDLSRIQVE
ncbi:MAG: hypothetical protein JNK48_31995 [Bryobacterales bacterium]|nr:hypothetical protein [Bryobacterales bacterium]